MRAEKTAIKVEGLWKRYKIGQKEKYLTFTDTLANLFRAKKRGKREFWALKDISFEVKRGEVLGIIGRNGAGKSTLLKVLSRITEPTRGVIRLDGRLSSLLEVGTGFHPELTGRENIYLNGSILGMTRKEINKKFKRIVEFAGVQNFLETPVKRYSSGMYVRLAFAVAAHLEPELLLIDEVLAVGDIGFQKKCLSKMKDVASSGRTVLFVSHNMGAIASLCTRCIYIDEGKIKHDGAPKEVISRYLTDFASKRKESIRNRKDRKGNGKVRMTDIRIIDSHEGKPVDTVIDGQDVIIEIDYESRSKALLRNFNIGLAFFTQSGQFVTVLNSQQASNRFDRLEPAGTVKCRIPRFPLMKGSYYIRATLHVANELVDQVDSALDIGVSQGDFFGTGRSLSIRQQGVYVDHHWTKKG